VVPTAERLLDGSSRPLDPRVRIVWGTGAAAIVLVAGIGTAIALAVAGAAGWALGLVAAATLVALAGGVAWTQAAVARWSWRAWPDALELRHGVFVLRESLVPYHRIQQIDVVRDPLERALGLSTLELRTAAAATDAKVPGIPADAAESLRRALLERAHVDDAV
jgi:membrane protein YdbS with pleckstrin-like domain